MSDKIFQMDYSDSDGITLRFKPKGISLIPGSSCQHLKAANKELLLAFRALLDEAIDRMDTRPVTSRGPRNVPVKGEGE